MKWDEKNIFEILKRKYLVPSLLHYKTCILMNSLLPYDLHGWQWNYIPNIMGNYILKEEKLFTD